MSGPINWATKECADCRGVFIMEGFTLKGCNRDGTPKRGNVCHDCARARTNLRRANLRLGIKPAPRGAYVPPADFLSMGPADPAVTVLRWSL